MNVAPAMMVIRVIPDLVLWQELAGALLVTAALFVLWSRRQGRMRRARWVQDRLGELETYSRFELELPKDKEQRKFASNAKRICRLISHRSAFSRVALLTMNAEGQMGCVGSCGMDELTLTALEDLGERLLQDESTGVGKAPLSFSVVLGEWQEFAATPGCHEASIVPLRMQRGRLAGMIAVCSDAEMRRWTGRIEGEPGMPQALMPLEIFAAKLVRALERSRLIERLVEVERFAGAGRIMARAAHDLVDPLAAVMGCAELIVETAAEPRVRQDAATIAGQATRMRKTLRRLDDFWRQDDVVETARVPELVGEGS